MMGLLPRRLAKRFFPDLVDQLEGASGSRGAWSFAGANFPNVALRVTDAEGQPFLGLVLEARDWPHRPPSVRAARPDFQARVPADAVPHLEDEHGEKHVYDDPKARGKGAYFCVPGTREYHEDLGDVVPWESVRDLPEFQPVAVVDTCTDLIDRDERVEGQASSSR